MRHFTLGLVVALSSCVATTPGSSPPRVVEREPPPPREEGPPREGPPREGPPHEEGHGPVRHHESVLMGVVVNARTHQPVNGASVDITSPALDHSLNVQTGPDGRYRTEPIPSGNFAVRCRRDGYQVIDRSMVVGRGEAHLDFELIPK